MGLRWVKRGLSVVAVLVVLGAAAQLTGVLPHLPFGVSTVDRSQPAVLEAVRDLSQYHAAAGDYQVVVDIEQDVELLPSFLAGERTLFVAAGTVNAYVDLGGLADGALTVSPDGEAVELRLPRAALDKPNLDQERSYVFSQRRGLADRLNDLVETDSQQQFYLAGEKRIAEAAEESGLVARAEENTRVMLTGLLQALGFRVTILTADEPR